MGALLAWGDCGRCGAPFAFNPDLVPSLHLRRVRADDSDGELTRMCAGLGIDKAAVLATFGVRAWVALPDATAAKEPLCAECVAALNRLRVSMGLEPWRIPPGAYEAAEVE